MSVDLDELERLLGAMTPGPWRWGDWSATYGTWEREATTLEHAPDYPSDGLALRERKHSCRSVLRRKIDDDARDEDLAGIVALRNAAPAILAELRALRAERDGLRAEVEAMRAALNGLADERVDWSFSGKQWTVLRGAIDRCLAAVGIDVVHRLDDRASRAGKEG